MKGKRHTPEQIIAKLWEAEADLNGGQTIGLVCQKLGVSEQTFHSWRNQFGGMKSEVDKRLKELEEENLRLKASALIDPRSSLTVNQVQHFPTGACRTFQPAFTIVGLLGGLNPLDI